jgi:hypothetical protein
MSVLLVPKTEKMNLTQLQLKVIMGSMQTRPGLVIVIDSGTPWIYEKTIL